MDIVCSSATITTLDSPSLVDGNTALTIGTDGLGTVVYQDDSNGQQTVIKVAHCLNITCTSATIGTVDTFFPVNGGSFRGAPGTVAIAATATGSVLAYTRSAGSLAVATCFDQACLSVASRVVVDSVPSALNGLSPSIAIGSDNLPLVSYLGDYTSGGSDLKVMRCLDQTCSTNLKTIVATGGFQGWFDSLAIGSDGFGVISYQDEVHKNLAVAHCANVACSTVTNTTLLDEFGDVGFFTSMSIGSDGLPLISYYDLTDTDLKVAHCGDVACAQPLQAPFLHRHP